MEARPRLFVALMLGRELGAEVARRVAEATVSGASPASPERDDSLRRYAPADLHLTLFFLGATDADRVEPLGGALAELAPRHGPLELRLTRAGAFPARGRERVLWLGVDESPGGEARPGGLARLAAEVAGACVRLGARAEERPWRAHLTVARVRAVAGVRERARARVPSGFYDLDLGLEWKPTRLQLVESSAGREPRNEQRESYRVVAEFELASR